MASRVPIRPAHHHRHRLCLQRCYAAAAAAAAAVAVAVAVAVAAAAMPAAAMFSKAVDPDSLWTSARAMLSVACPLRVPFAVF